MQPKLDADQRRDLIAALPILLRRLQEGLGIAAVDEGERKRFFSALVDCHAAAVKAGLRGESAASLFSTTPNDSHLAPLFEKLIAAEQAAMNLPETVALVSLAFSSPTKVLKSKRSLLGRRVLDGVADTTKAISGEQPQSLSPHRSVEFEPNAISNDLPSLDIPPAALKRGTWVEFLQIGGERIRAKLSWVSPLKGVYLFTNPGASEALSIAPEALHRELAKGRARVIEESSLMERAVDRMVSSLGNATPKS